MTDTVGKARSAQRQRGQIQRLVGLAVIGLTQIEQALDIGPQVIGPALQVPARQTVFELLVARRYRRMGCKGHVLGDALDRRRQIHLGFCLHQTPQPLEL
jgi:hypothetical protein